MKNINISKRSIYLIIFLVFVTGCFNNEDKSVNSISPTETSKEEDCDEKKAKETIEKIKTEEFSLNKANDTGCAVEETSKKEEVLPQPTAK